MIKWRPMKCEAYLVVVSVLLMSGCGSGAGGNDSAKTEIIVSAASSLKPAFEAYGKEIVGARPRFSFGGSSELSAQIESGARPDVFAAANTKLPESLFRKGIVEKPIVFATNTLVIAVPAGESTVKSVADLGASKIKIAVGSASVPVGDYTRQAINRLPRDLRDAIGKNFRSNEPDVKGIVGKLAAGAVEAGFLYATDVIASGGRLRAVQLPTRLQPKVAYAVAAVKGSPHRTLALAFIAGLRDDSGREALDSAGFGPPSG